MGTSELHKLLSKAPLDTKLAHDGKSVFTVAVLRHHCQWIMRHLNNIDAKEIGVACECPWHFIVTLLACQQLGKTPIIFSNIQHRQVERYQNKWHLFTDMSLSSYSSQTVFIELPPLSTSTESVQFKSIDPVKADLHLYTSGSTGQPTAIYKQLDHLESEAKSLERQFGESIDSTSTFISSVAHHHIYGFLFRIIWPLISGRPFDCRLVKTEEALLQQLTQSTIFVSSPAFLSRLESMNSLKNLNIKSFSSGGKLEIKHAKKALERFGELPIEVYGSTETGGVAWRKQHATSTPWRSFCAVRISVENECLVVSSPYFSEYLYKTQDRVNMIDEQYFELIGRQDRIVKISEKRISLDEIEATLATCDGIVDCAVVALKKSNRLRVVAAIVLNRAWQSEYQKQGHSWLWKNIRQQLKGFVEPVALPRQVRVLKEIPCNQQAKRSYVELENLFQ